MKIEDQLASEEQRLNELAKAREQVPLELAGKNEDQLEAHLKQAKAIRDKAIQVANANYESAKAQVMPTAMLVHRYVTQAKLVERLSKMVPNVQKEADDQAD